MKNKLLILGLLFLSMIAVSAHPQYAKTTIIDGGDMVVLTRYQNDLSIAVVTEIPTNTVWCRITTINKPRWFLPTDSSHSKLLKKMDDTRFWGRSTISKSEKKVKVTCTFNDKTITTYSIYNPQPDSFRQLREYVFNTWVGHFVKRYIH